MASVTEAYEIGEVICSTLSQWLDVVYFRSRNQLAVLLADLAERIRDYECLTDPSPLFVVIPFVDLRIPAVPVVSLVHDVSMFHAV